MIITLNTFHHWLYIIYIPIYNQWFHLRKQEKIFLKMYTKL